MYSINILRGNLGATGKVVVTGSSPRNNLLCKKQGRLRTIYQKWWDPFPDPAYAGALVHRVALFIQ